MIIPTGTEISGYGVVQPQRKRPGTSTAVGSRGQILSRFDQISIRERETSAAMQMKSQITREVRESVTTGTLAALRSQVEAGTYQIDPASIARRMLLLGEE